MDALTNTQSDIKLAIQNLTMGNIIGYPTESVYGLGCDPFNEQAVNTLLEMKERPLGKGFILVAADFEQVSHLTLPIPPRALAQVQASWPGPVTWIFPCSEAAPHWITGNNNSIALRISAHPIIQKLCHAYRGPIVSTSANRHGNMPARSLTTLSMGFGDQLSCIIQGELGGNLKPTMIKDAISGEILRA